MGDRNEALVETIRGGSSTDARIDAFDALVRASGTKVGEILRDLALDEHVETDIRLKALTALGRESGGDHETLVAALKSPSQQVVRRAATVLGTLAGTEQLEALKAVRTGNAVTRGAVGWAKTLVSYRNGLGAYALPTRIATVPMDTRSGSEARVRPPDRKLMEELTKVAARDPFGVELTVDGALAFMCEGREFAALMGVEVAREGWSLLRSRQAMPVVVLQRGLETDRMEPSHVVLTDPRRDGGLAVRVARRSGPVILSGRATAERGVVVFELAATETPYSPPAQVRGRFDADRGALAIDQLSVSSRLTRDQMDMTKRPVRQHRPLGDR